MPLTPEDVRNKQFTTTRLKPGYDENEVDAFLDEVEAELTGSPGERRAALQAGRPAQREGERRGRTAENEDLRSSSALSAANPPPPPQRPPRRLPADAGAPLPPGGAPRLPPDLALAQRTADEHIAEARTQADRIISEARMGRPARREAEDKVRQMIGRWRTSGSSSSARSRACAVRASVPLARLKAYLESQLRDPRPTSDGRRRGTAGGQAQRAAARASRAGQGQQGPGAAASRRAPGRRRGELVRGPMHQPGREYRPRRRRRAQLTCPTPSDAGSRELRPTTSLSRRRRAGGPGVPFRSAPVASSRRNGSRAGVAAWIRVPSGGQPGRRPSTRGKDRQVVSPASTPAWAP